MQSSKLGMSKGLGFRLTVCDDAPFVKGRYMKGVPFLQNFVEYPHWDGTPSYTHFFIATILLRKSVFWPK